MIDTGYTHEVTKHTTLKCATRNLSIPYTPKSLSTHTMGSSARPILAVPAAWRPAEPAVVWRCFPSLFRWSGILHASVRKNEFGDPSGEMPGLGKGED
jgi:hypothetical protein